MKSICALFLFIFNLLPLEKNAPISRLDLKKYSGTWYSLYSIPTIFDKGSRETTTKYSLNKEGYFDVLTTYKKPHDEQTYSRNSKMFPSDTGSNGELKAQFIWPIKVDYWIIELADDYNYVVVGHPDRKFLFIMSRNKNMPKKQYEEIIARCKAKGYDVSKLTSQHHDKLG
ncbi:lipocalin family protein [Pedobacter rhizosphaerae]|uniref:Apolipoprotein D and lipocalin family protein n=1 Tax=Pedobacter rhizosphaerae TaxID=390241 RepID=A0A1H9W6Y4_9SPHI|nr:lipocalin family protein [Pedobacter rhizosphaerae]SES29233.1 apolipoprotein D and lipocalin family protein [Pedobacter rhizosphaerae]